VDRSLADDRFGSFPDFDARNGEVRFDPRNGHRVPTHSGPLGVPLVALA
jgi:hypothetical protein